MYTSTTNNPTDTLLQQIQQSKQKSIEILRTLAQDQHITPAKLEELLGDVEDSYPASNKSPAFPKIRAAWTKPEDRLLMMGVQVYGPNTESWPRIALLVPGRTNKSCRKRWFHSLDPSLHKGPWTAAEDDLLRARVQQYPSQWSRVAEGIVGRTDDQCAKRWRESLDPEIDRGKWRAEEDLLLLGKYKEFGTQWQKIATFFQGRPGLHCRNRWRKIQRILVQREKKQGGLGPVTPEELKRTLASITESVNKRKTAQRARPSNAPTDQAIQQRLEKEKSESPQKEPMPALFIPSEQPPSFPTATYTSPPLPLPLPPPAVKRTSSMMFAPSDEQRERLKQMGLNLYGCAAAPNRCQATFSDSMSLNMHLRNAHPQIATTLGQLPASMDKLKPYKCAMEGCSHAYKNVSGLEYHIFQSRKSNHHLQLACSEKGCEEVFGSLVELRHHMSNDHQRPIRRATKPTTANRLHMPMIPETNVSTPGISQMAAAMLQQPMFPSMSGQNSSILSAPALVSVTGGEANISSYFALDPSAINSNDGGDTASIVLDSLNQPSVDMNFMHSMLSPTLFAQPPPPPPPPQAQAQQSASMPTNKKTRKASERPMAGSQHSRMATEAMTRSGQLLYTPQPNDLAQFQAPNRNMFLDLHQHPDSWLNGGPRSAGPSYLNQPIKPSDPGSPMAGYLSTVPSVSTLPSTSQTNRNGRMPPHWVDPDLLSVWIATANGDEADVMNLATATAMGVTPGGGQQARQEEPTDNELLQMFEAVNPQ